MNRHLQLLCTCETTMIYLLLTADILTVHLINTHIHLAYSLMTLYRTSPIMSAALHKIVPFRNIAVRGGEKA